MQQEWLYFLSRLLCFSVVNNSALVSVFLINTKGWILVNLVPSNFIPKIQESSVASEFW